MNSMRANASRTAGIITIAFGLAGCGADPTTAGQEPVGELTFAISVVPANARCLQVVGTGPVSFTATAALTPATSSASITIGRLPIGATTINASAFDAACTALAGQTATWIADPFSAVLAPGVPANFTLTLRQNNPLVVDANFVGNVAALSGGYDATGLVMTDGTARIVGGWILPTTSGILTNAPSLTGIAELAAPLTYNAHGCARSNTGAVSCWGFNTAGELGTGVALGGFTQAVTAVAGAPTSAAIAVGGHHTCAITTYGAVYCWGSNSNGQLGRGTTANSSTPTQVSLPSSDLIAAGFNFTCVNAGTSINCWGDNSNGQLGDGTTTQRLSPVSIGLGGTVSLAASYTHVCAVRADGTVRCWGSNSNGQLGDGTTTLRMTPTQVTGISDAVQVAVGTYHSCVLRQNGTVSCFGGNQYGQIGDGTATGKLTPTTVPGISGAKKLLSGFAHNCALLDNQTLHCWGWNGGGQCADNSLGNNYKPVKAIVQ